MTKTFSFSLDFIRSATSAHVFQTSASHFTDVVIDGRAANPGALFVALRGAHYEGSQFVAQAIEHGATGVMVETGQGASIAEKFPALTVLEVPHPQEALAQLAAAHRLHMGQLHKLKIIGVTGSYGKTTTKDMLAAMLQAQYPNQVLATQGNLNNHLGVPLTLLKLRPHHLFAVIEMGMSALGEIAFLSSLAKPDLGIETCIGPAHLESLGSLENIARSKAELFQSLPDQGAAIYPVGSQHHLLMQHALQAGVTSRLRSCAVSLEFSVTPLHHIDVYAQVLQHQTTGFELRLFCAKNQFFAEETIDVFVPLLGIHHAVNAALAACAARVVGIGKNSIIQGLLEVIPGKHRGNLVQVGGRFILDDCYNANPDSVKAAIALISMLPHPRKFVVFGDMLELGTKETTYHKQIGSLLADSPIHGVFTLGTRAARAALVVKKHAHGKIPALSFDSIEELGLHLLKTTGPGDLILLKGSRGMELERLLPFLENSTSKKRDNQ